VLIGSETRSQTPLADSLQRVVASHPHDTIGIKALIALSTEISRHDIVKVKEYALQALHIAYSLHTIVGVSGSCAHLTNYYSNAGMPDSALYYLGLMKTLAENNPAHQEICANYHVTTGLFYKNRGEFDAALPHMLKALEYMTAARFDLVRAGQLLNIGNTYHNQGDLKKAADYHLKALRLFEHLGNQRGQSFCLQSLGNDYFKLNYFTGSKKYYLQSLALKEALNDQRGLVTTWTGLGGVYTQLNQFGLAGQYYQKALMKARSLKLPLDELRTLYDMGLLQVKMNEPSLAKATFGEGLPLARQRGDSLMSAKFGTQLAVLQQDSLKRSELEKTLIGKATVANRAGDREAEADAYLKLSEWKATHQQFEQAFTLLKKHHQIRDSVLGKNVLVQLKQLEEQYAQEKSRKEIILLKKDQELKKAIIAQQEAQQKILIIVFFSFLIIAFLLFKYFQFLNRTRRALAIEQVRNHIARDLHDDIGSALSSIHINSQLAIHDSTGASLLLQRISESAARMMENMSDIVWSINPENDTLEKMLIKMKEFAAEILEPKNISYSFEESEELSKVKLSVETRKNLYLIFKESINNAAKYSGGTAVIITLRLQNNQLHLSIRDNGTGFEATTIRYGNGLLNMSERARSLHGKLTRLSAPGQGTEIVAQLPIT
jgi:signal transduction histidine kinase